jgi:hypothetical protein
MDLAIDLSQGLVEMSIFNEKSGGFLWLFPIGLSLI